jgi:hypothetical protein
MVVPVALVLLLAELMLVTLVSVLVGAVEVLVGAVEVLVGALKQTKANPSTTRLSKGGQPS